MQGSEIVKKIEQHLPAGSKVEVYSEDGYHFDVLVISKAFESLSQVSRQRKIYSILGDDIRSGALHAIQLTTMTPSEHKEEA